MARLFFEYLRHFLRRIFICFGYRRIVLTFFAISAALFGYAKIQARLRALPFEWDCADLHSEIGRIRDSEETIKPLPGLRCKLPEIDPWKAADRHFFDPNYNISFNDGYTLTKCVPRYPQLSKMVNGRVVLDPSLAGRDCKFRCLYPKNESYALPGEWKRTDEKPDCDVLEVRCSHRNWLMAYLLSKLAKYFGENPAFEYNYLHAQIYSKEREYAIAQQRGKGVPPDVHLIILDSTSFAQFRRGLPKTEAFLRDKMNAIPFAHLNKIGVNSRPNGYAIFMGLHTYFVKSSVWGKGYTPERDLETMGRIYLDNETFIGFDYRAAGYCTMMAEDWVGGVFNYPNLNGFERPPMDHYMRPFQTRTNRGRGLPKIMHDLSCREPYHYAMQYLADFIDAYADQPKFSITWIIRETHDNVNGIYRLDSPLSDFLKNHAKKLSNSFLFVMGDHGPRFGPYRETKQGELEDNNPALFVALPQKLRQNSLLERNLRENSRQLVTHFDVHATLQNIAKVAQKMRKIGDHSLPKFKELLTKVSFGTEHGQSLFQPLNASQQRNCATLKIPLEFCLCQLQSRDISKSNSSLGEQMAQTMVGRMNADLAQAKVHDRCAKLKLNPAAEVEVLEYEPDKGADMFKVTFETLPGNGRFWGYVQLLDRDLPGRQRFSLISSRFPRLNAYRDQVAPCWPVVIEVESYCFCKNLF